uniref:Uncharacterized protein n=1 Tax=Anguilla anguilla TaxID=7936 RepID=A0A0E9W6G7_ANGAN
MCCSASPHKPQDLLSGVSECSFTHRFLSIFRTSVHRNRTQCLRSVTSIHQL